MNCTHQQIKVIPTPETIHFAKEICETCGRFIQWLPHPRTIERELVESGQRKALWDKPISEWEKQFLMSVEKMGGKMSPKQRGIFERMVKQYAV